LVIFFYKRTQKRKKKKERRSLRIYGHLDRENCGPISKGNTPNASSINSEYSD
jgi:hypothetical protein